VFQRLSIFVAIFAVISNLAIAQDEEALAKAAQNPLASMISLPFQNNTNFGLGSYSRTQNVLNIQPVYPFAGKKWNIITRTILSVISQPDITQADGRTFGLGDTTLTAWLSPAKAASLTWGIGSALMIPTSTDDALGAGRWGIGPSVVALVMPGKWVVGGLISNIWSVGGGSEKQDVNQFLFQYFINYNLSAGWYLASAPIITANWKAPEGQKWIVPFGIGVGKVHRFGKQPVNMSAHFYMNVVKPDIGPDWTLRLKFQLMFPKK
jgi:hypothetical protein